MPVAVDHFIRHHADDRYEDRSIVVWLEGGSDPWTLATKQRYWSIDLPKTQKYQNEKMRKESERTRHYLPALNVGFVEELHTLEEKGKISFVKRCRPDIAFYQSEEDFVADQSNSLSAKKGRRRAALWLKARNRLLPLIQELTKDADLPSLIEGNEIEKRIHLLTQGIEDAKQRKKRRDVLQSVWRRWLFGGRDDNALLPNWATCGAPGKVKAFTASPGPYNTAGLRPFLMTEGESAKCRRGWKKHKKPGVSDELACVRISQEFYAESVTWISPVSCKVVLLPADQRPTDRQIMTAGKEREPAKSSFRISLGENTWNRQYRPMRSGDGGRILALGQLGVLDATSEDQRPVSSASRLKQLPSSWRTLVIDFETEYIFGLYRGFEKGGTIPGLLSLLHAAEPKDAWFEAIMGRPLQPGEWHSRAFKRVLGDAGDLKNEAAITAMTLSETSAEFTRSYAAEHKPVERTHKVLHRLSDHLMGGSTRGKLFKRGDEVDDDSFVNFLEGYPPIINAILFHNNEQLAPHLLNRLEIKKDFEKHGLLPTRKNIVEFCIREGYVASVPCDLEMMRAQCMPRLAATIKQDGIHVFDPRCSPNKPSYIPDLIYDSDWLHKESGLKMRGSNRPCEIQINPSAVGVGWINIGGFKRLELRVTDEELRTLTLADWLSISDDSKLKAFLAIGQQQSGRAGVDAVVRVTNERAKKAKDAEVAAAKSPGSKRPAADKKRENLVEEQARNHEDRLGITQALKESAEMGSLETQLEQWLNLGSPPEDPMERLMAEMRTAKASD